MKIPKNNIIAALILSAAATAAQAQTNLGSARFRVVQSSTVTPYHVVERAENYKVMEGVRSTVDSPGQVVLQTNRYTVLGNGMHYKDAQANWIESQPIVQSFANAIVCTGASYRVILNSNLNTAGAVDLETPDHQRIVSHPLCLGFFDPESGRSVVLATIKDCQAQIVSNRVVYADAFQGSGIEAGVTYTYGVGRFHQDVTFAKRPPLPPSHFGMGSHARLEIISELLEAPEPVRETRVLKRETNQVLRARMAEPDLVDESLKFGADMRMPDGRAFTTGANSAERFRGAPVAKKLLRTADGRTVLIEAVEWRGISKDLEKLPKGLSGMTEPAHQPGQGREFPERRLAGRPTQSFEKRLASATKRGGLEVAALSPQAAADAQAGFVIDYYMVAGDYGPYPFFAGCYLVDREVDIFGPALCDCPEFKFMPGWDGDLYFHDCLDRDSYGIKLTARDDDSLTPIDVSTGNPFGQYYGCAGLFLASGEEQWLIDIEMRFMRQGVICNAQTLHVNGCTVRNCDVAFTMGSSDCVLDFQQTPWLCNVNQLCFPGDCAGADNAGNPIECYDLNGDGLPDPWEVQHFGTIWVDPNADPDHDGFSNLQEYQAGTDPADGLSFPVAPSISFQPLSQSVAAYDMATLAVTATGTAPLAYQWRQNDWANNPVDIPDATNATLTFPDITGKYGTYSVRISNPYGSAISSDANLTDPGSTEYPSMQLLGQRQGYIFKSDWSYFINSTVEIYGADFEGGTVIKFGKSPDAKLVLKTPAHWEVGPYNPVIFSAADDDAVGWVVSTSTHVPQGYYANTALEIPATADTKLDHIRVAYAQTAVHYLGNTGAPVTDWVRDVQIVHCGTAFLSEGTSSRPRTLDLGNVLMADVGKAMGGSHFAGRISHLTLDGPVDSSGVFAVDDSSGGLGLMVTNSIFVNLASLGSGLALDGSHNGFFPGSGPQFGSASIVESQPPFAPSSAADPNSGDPIIFIANGQGSYYLRDGSQFFGAGSADIDASLRSDLARSTTIAPELFAAEPVNFSRTMGPTAIRDTGPNYAIGYHYPAVDYVVSGATVNNCTLNIDQGTVLAFTDPWVTWGVRLNPGGRLNVNGVPTNRVVFARLQAVQESPLDWWIHDTPMLTFCGIPFGNVPVTPLCEAKIHYADFPSVVNPGGNYHIAPGFADPTFNLISNFELDGCHFEGGLVCYQTTGPAGRTATIRNNIFERSSVVIDGLWNWLGGTVGDTEETLAAANNLFWNDNVWLGPLSGNNWTFTDNIFDHTSFPGGTDLNGGYTRENGPVAANHHSAYIGMNGFRLIPEAPTSTDLDLPGLDYDTGPLGRFYLSATTTQLIDKGSRSSGAAGLFHFTTQANGSREDATQVDIGPHYLTLANGQALDSNGDGIPDFLADRNGNGVKNEDEVPWDSDNNGSLTILSPLSGSTVSGTVEFRVDLGSMPSSVQYVEAVSDGPASATCAPMRDPAGSSARLEIDTRSLSNGPHSVAIRAGIAPTGDVLINGATLQSESVVLNVANAVAFPDWHDRAELAVSVNCQTSATAPNCNIYFFDASFPFLSDPSSAILGTASADNSSGRIDFSDSPDDLGYAPDNPNIYSITVLGPAGSGEEPLAVMNPNTTMDASWTFPVGLWVTAYADDAVDYFHTIDKPCLDFRILPPGTDRWWHDAMLLCGWYPCGLEATAGDYSSLVAFPSADGKSGQTWPLRLTADNEQKYPDQNELRKHLAFPAVRNFFADGHGMNSFFLGILASEYQNSIANRRFRFAFLHGCQTGKYPGLFSSFGASSQEIQNTKTLAEIVDAPPQDSLLGGPLRPVDYEVPDSTHPDRLGIRPGVFLGWRYNVLTGHYLGSPGQRDPTTGLVCPYDKYAALAHWHEQMILYWRELGRPLLDSILDAITDAAQGGCFPPWDLTWYQIGVDDNQRPVYFNIDTCLTISGCGGIHFNEYNHADDTW